MELDLLIHKLSTLQHAMGAEVVAVLIPTNAFKIADVGVSKDGRCAYIYVEEIKKK